MPKKEEQDGLSLLFLLLYLGLLMLRTKQVVDGLHRIEGFDRHLYEYRIPVAHRTIPQTGQL